MNKNSRDVVRNALETALATLRTLLIEEKEPHWIYQRDASGGWQGRQTLKTSLLGLFYSRNLPFDSWTQGIEDALRRDHPEHMIAGTKMSAGQLQPVMLLNQLLAALWEKHETFNVTKEQIEAVLQALSDFIDRSTIPFRFYAPALNLDGARDTPPISFPSGITLRPITDEECTRFYGGNADSQFMRSRPLCFPSFTFLADIEVQKIVGSYDQLGEPNEVSEIREKLDRIVLALSSFKEGAIGYDGIHTVPMGFCIGVGAASTYHFFHNQFIPWHTYKIEASDVVPLTAHAALFSSLHRALEMACNRLMDATRRNKHRDSIVDAVIGLESILLSEIGDTSYRGETRLRFSLNYSTLFSSPEERKKAFGIARDLYDLRSKIAHGEAVTESQTVPVGEGMPINEAAMLARSVLRNTIKRFLGNAASPEFVQAGYWNDRRLGITTM